MKKNFFKFFLVALLSVLGVNQSKADVYANPQYQGIGTLDFVKFGYYKSNGDTLLDKRGFGGWTSDTPDHIGYTAVNDGRYFVIKLDLPEAGTYKISFVYGAPGDRDEGKNIYTATSTVGTLTADDRNDSELHLPKTADSGCSTMTGKAVLKLTVASAGKVDVSITHTSGNMDAKTFKVTKSTRDAQPEAQGPGVLSIDKFEYLQGTSAGVPRENFGYWFEDDFIGFFKGGRAFTVKLDLPAAGKYELDYKVKGSGENSKYKISAEPDVIGGEKTIVCNQVPDEKKTIDLVATNSGEVNITFTNTVNWIDFRDFVLLREMFADPTYQEVGELSFYKFGYSAVPEGKWNFGHWFNDDYIGNFDTEGRQITIKLDLPVSNKSNKYRVEFDINTGYNGAFSVTTSTPNCTVTTESGGNTITCSGKVSDFSQHHYFDIETSVGGQVDIVLARTADWIDLKNFKLSTKITFDANGGSCLQTEKFSEGNIVGGLPTAMRKDFALKGWFTAPTGGEQVLATTPCDANLTLYAQWVDNSNYKAITPSSPSFSWNAGYAFVHGLYTTDITAKWVDNNANVNGQSREVTAGSTVVMKFAKAYRYVTSQGTKDYDVYVAVTPSDTISSSTTWTAIIDEKEDVYYLKIMPQAAPIANFVMEIWLQDGNVVADDVEFIAGHCYIAQDEYVSVYGDTAVISAKLEKENNYDYDQTHNGWKALTNNVNKPANYVIGSGYTSDHHVRIAYSSTTEGRNAEMVMGYMNCTYTFNYPEGTQSRTYRMNENVQLTKDAESVISYRKGWKITEGTVGLIDGTKLGVNDIINEDTRDQIQVLGNATIQAYAKFTLTYDKNKQEAEVEPTSKQVEMGEKYGDLPVPTCSDYVFDGWYTQSSGGDSIKSTDYITNNADYSIYAHWKLANVTVTLKVNGGNPLTEVDSVKAVTIGLPYGTAWGGSLPTPTWEKHNFQGWFTQATGGDTVKSTTIVTQTTDHNLWAQWKEEEVGDGSDETDVTVAKTKVKNKLQEWKEECGGTKGINLTIVRTIYKDGYYNTLCLPFDLTNSQIKETFGEYKDLQEFKSATVTGDETNRTITIELEPATTITSGKAYLISFEEDENLTQLDFKDVIVRDTAALTAEKAGNMAYQGILAPFHLKDNDKDLLFLGENNKLYWPNDDGTFMKGFRAYFKVTTQQQSPSSPYKRGMKAAFSDKKTPTSVHDAQCTMHEIQKLVEQGRVVIITNGKKYDLQGKLL